MIVKFVPGAVLLHLSKVVPSVDIADVMDESQQSELGLLIPVKLSEKELFLELDVGVDFLIVEIPLPEPRKVKNQIFRDGIEN